MEIYSILFKTKSGQLVKIETSKRGGFPKFNIYYKNKYFNVKSFEDKIKNASLARKILFPKGVTTTLITPYENVNNCENLELAVCLSILCKSTKNTKILIASSINNKGECINTEILPQPLINLCVINGIEHVIISKTAANKLDNIDTKNLKFYFVDNISDAFEIFNKLEYKIENIQNNNIDNQEISSKQTIESDKDIFSSIIGLDNCKYLLSIALSGKHNALIIGEKESGKTLLLNELSKINLTYSKKIIEQQKDNELILKANGNTKNFSDVKHVLLNENNIKYYFKDNKNSLIEILPHTCKYILIDDITKLSRQSMQILKSFLDKNIYEKDGEIYPLNISIIATSRPYNNLSENKSHWKDFNEILYDKFNIVCYTSDKVEKENNNNDTKNQKNIDNYYSNILKARELQEVRYENCSELMFNSDLVKTINDDNKNEYISYALKAFDNEKISIKKKLTMYSIARTIADFENKENIDEEQIRMSKIISN